MITMFRALAAAAALFVFAAGLSTAQEAAAPPAPSPEAAAAAATGDPGEAARALIDALRDEGARAALIAELERLAGPPTAAAEGDATPATPATSRAGGLAAFLAAAPAEGGEASAGEAEGAPPTPSVGRRLALVTSEAASDLVETGQGFLNGLSAMQRRLALIGERGDELWALALDLLPVLVVTVAAFLILRTGARTLYRRWGKGARTAAVGVRTVVGVSGVLVDALVVIVAWAIGYALTLAAIRGASTMAVEQSLYLNAFLAVELGKVLIRGVLSPSTGDLRPVPLDDRAARYWNRRLSLIVSLLGYGLLLFVPIVNQTVSFFTGRAVEVVLFSLVVLWSAILVIRHRRAPAEYAQRRAEASGGDATLRLLAFVMRFWHWPALIWLASIFVIAVAQSGTVVPILEVTGRVIGVIALGVAVGALIARGAKRGLRLPEEISSQVPMLEQRLNGFVQRFLGVLRFLVFAFTLGFVINASGLLDVEATLAGWFGEDFGGVVFSVFFIVTFAFLLWLAMASWVDFKLNPDRSVMATQREQTLLTLMRNAVTVAIVTITLMIALSELGLDIGPLLASAGVIGLAIGFGAQKLVQDIITGVFIQLENAFNVGDVVTVGGVTGVVEKLTIRSVSLRDLNGVFHIIPFSSVDVATNFMRGFAYHVADFGVAYREDAAEVRRVMQAAFDDMIANEADVRGWVIGGLDYWGINALGDSAVVHRARIRTLPGKQWATGRTYNGYLKKHADAAGVEIPFPHMTLWFGQEKDGGAPPLRHAPARPGSGDPEALVESGAAAPLGAAAAPR